MMKEIMTIMLIKISTLENNNEDLCVIYNVSKY